MQAVNRKMLTRGKMQTENKVQTADWVFWENHQRFAIPSLDPLRNDVWKRSTEIPCWWHLTSQIWEVLLIGRGKFLANQALYPDLGSATSSVWNFCTCFSHVISWESQWWCRKMSGCLLRLQTESRKRKRTASNWGLECRPSLKFTCRGDLHSLSFMTFYESSELREIKESVTQCANILWPPSKHVWVHVKDGNWTGWITGIS